MAMNTLEEKRVEGRRRVITTVVTGFGRGFVHGLGGPVHMIQTDLVSPTYRGAGIADDWRRVGKSVATAIKIGPRKK